MKKQTAFLTFTFALGIVAFASLFIWIGIHLLAPGDKRTPAEGTIEPVATGPVSLPDKVGADSIDVVSGFIAKGNFQVVKRHCMACHSSKLVLQNRATREGWEEMIHWMQATQKLWDLGEDEPLILDYLATYYGPQKKGRRSNLVVAEWYEIPE